VKVRRKLGIGSGSALDWEEGGDAIVVRKAGRYTWEDIHRAIFAQKNRKLIHGRIPLMRAHLPIFGNISQR
jgi:bifunctional DNA-binding transcriptional regulator/antitoxin component of YhaV-PrlF toxin-antitoxin module